MNNHHQPAAHRKHGRANTTSLVTPTATDGRSGTPGAPT
jgi:hypothetical protein